MTAPHQIPGRRRRSVVSAPACTAVGYLRVSTDEQAASGAGLEAQRAAITADAERRGWTITAWHTDEGLSGGLAPADRPGLTAALEAVQDREAAALMAAKLDRVSRSIRDAADLMDQARAEGWELATADLAVDTSTPAGEAAAAMMTVFSQLERRMIGQRTRDALAARKAAGVQLGQPTQVPDAVLTRIITEAAEGRSLRAIARGLMADGVPTGSGRPTWHPPQVQRAMDSQRGQRIAADLFPEQVPA